MTHRKFRKIINNMTSEVMNDTTHYLLTEYHNFDTGNIYGEWGWSRKIENIKKFVLYFAIVKTIIDHNNNEPGVISNELLDKLFNGKRLNLDAVNSLNSEEKMFYFLFDVLKDAKGYDEIVQSINTMIKFLNENNYKINVFIYKDAREALPKALEWDQYLPEGEAGFGEFLKNCLED